MRFLKATIPALVAIALFAAFANWVPQVGWRPQKLGEITAQMSPQELARVGEVLVRDRGCLICHMIDPSQGRTQPVRAPNLAGVGSRSKVDYLIESLYTPGAKVVEPYPNIMPPATTPPAKLNFEEITAVVDYLLSLGGTPRVRVGELPRPPQ